MKISNPRRRCISSRQLSQVQLIIAREWEETILIVRERANQRQQQHIILVNRAHQQIQQRVA